MKYHILGMAKSCLSIEKAGTSRNLELDILRLIYSIDKSQSDNVLAFILIYNKTIADRIDLWKNKYAFEKSDKLHVLCFDDLSPSTIIQIAEEKKANSNFSNSNSDFGKKTIEDELEKKVNKYLKDNFQYKSLSKDKKNFPVGINWDFYELIEIEST